MTANVALSFGAQLTLAEQEDSCIGMLLECRVTECRVKVGCDFVHIKTKSQFNYFLTYEVRVHAQSAGGGHEATNA